MNKNKTVIFRVSDEEYEDILKRSKDFKFRTISEYCRFISLNAQRIDIIIGDTIVNFTSGSNL